MERGSLMNADSLIILNGRLTKEVDLRYSQNGNAVAKFTVAVNRSRKEQDGSRKADFHNCVAFHKTAELIAQHFIKGSMIGIVGELQDNNYEKDGVKHYNKQIVVDTFGFRESRRSDDNSPQQNDTGVSNQFEGNYPSNQNNTFKSQDNSQQTIDGMSEHGFNTKADPFSGTGQTIDISSDDLPF